MVFKLSGRFSNCPDGFQTVRTVFKLSGRFSNCPDGFQTVRMVLKQSVKNRKERLLRTFLTCRGKADPRASSGKFLRVSSCYPECFRFLCLCHHHHHYDDNYHNGPPDIDRQGSASLYSFPNPQLASSTPSRRACKLSSSKMWSDFFLSPQTYLHDQTVFSLIYTILWSPALVVWSNHSARVNENEVKWSERMLVALPIRWKIRWSRRSHLRSRVAKRTRPLSGSLPAL